MSKFTTIAAICLFSLMATASYADDMMSDEGMMEDDMHESMDDGDMMTEDMSDSMEDDMDMESDMDMEGDMDEEMESDGM